MKKYLRNWIFINSYPLANVPNCVLSLGIFLSCVFIIFGGCVCANAGAIPSPPSWLSKMPPVPGWWNNVTVDLRFEQEHSDEWVREWEHETAHPFPILSPASNWWARVWLMQDEIKKMVDAGISPTIKRQELIKYMNFFADSKVASGPDRRNLKADIAETYYLLGDYKRSAKCFFDLCNEYNPDWDSIRNLAEQYELLGEKSYERHLYEFVLKNFKDDSMAVSVANRRIACLDGDFPACKLVKPGWWRNFENNPSWWTNTSVTIPAFSSYDDQERFVTRVIGEDRNVRKRVKARVLILDFRPMTTDQRISSLLLAALAYARINDHHRAIELAWRIPEGFSCDRAGTVNALQFIAGEFDKLGEREEAAQVRVTLPCFGESGSTPQP